jgi:hypothetical protein
LKVFLTALPGTQVPDAERGELSTVALIPKGSWLYISARTKWVGSIRAAAQSTPGVNALSGHGTDECIPIVGGQPRVLVCWNDTGMLGVRPGETIIPRFKMEQAELFAIEFGD